MPGENNKKIHVRRRDFIKTTAMAGVAATLSETRLVGQDSEDTSKRRRKGKK